MFQSSGTIFRDCSSWELPQVSQVVRKPASRRKTEFWLTWQQTLRTVPQRLRKHQPTYSARAQDLGSGRKLESSTSPTAQHLRQDPTPAKSWLRRSSAHRTCCVLRTTGRKEGVVKGLKEDRVTHWAVVPHQSSTVLCGGYQAPVSEEGRTRHRLTPQPSVTAGLCDHKVQSSGSLSTKN